MLAMIVCCFVVLFFTLAFMTYYFIPACRSYVAVESEDEVLYFNNLGEYIQYRLVALLVLTFLVVVVIAFISVLSV